MTALIGIVAAAAALATPQPPLPAEGLVVSQGNGITFVDVRGRKLGHVDGLRLATEYALSSGVPRFRDGDGRLWSLDLRRRRFVRMPRGCIVASRRAVHWVLLCGRIEHGTVLPTTVEELVGGRRQPLAGPAEVAPGGPAGYWVYARVGPDRRTMLLQWSGECESPTAFLLTPGRRLRPVGASTRRAAPESRALGWSPTGQPVVSFLGGICGSAYRRGSGVYSLDANGTARLIVRTKPRQRLAFWG